jgi:predicted acylesterase/phospholipase RssA
MADIVDNIPTFVVATKGLHADSPPTLFRSYQCHGHNASKCAIWEAVRATSAAPIFFKPITIEIPRPGATFIDGGLVYNNPAELALSEAKKIWTTAKKVRLVSLGTGRLKSVRIVQIESGPPRKKARWSGVVTSRIPGVTTASRLPSGSAALLSIGEACVQLTTNTEPVHERLLRQSTSSNPDLQFPYHRFNVDRDMQDIGLEEWSKMEEMAAHTAAYMEGAEGEIKRNNCVHDLMNESTQTIPYFN